MALLLTPGGSLVLPSPTKPTSGVVVVNTHPTELMGMGTDAQGTQSDIPAVLVNGADGQGLLQELLAPSSVDGTGGSALRLRLSAAAGQAAPGGAGTSATAGAGAGGQCGVEAQQQQAKRAQQVELLMSARAQHWLFHRLAADNRNANAALKRVLAQLQAHFVAQAQQQDAAAAEAAAAEFN